MKGKIISIPVKGPITTDELEVKDHSELAEKYRALLPEGIMLDMVSIRYEDEHALMVLDDMGRLKPSMKINWRASYHYASVCHDSAWNDCVILGPVVILTGEFAE